MCIRDSRYTSRKKALAQAAEAKQAFTILQREHEPDADRWLQETEQLQMCIRDICTAVQRRLIQLMKTGTEAGSVLALLFFLVILIRIARLIDCLLYTSALPRRWWSG